MIKVLVADDSPTARGLIVAILGMARDISVCGVATNGAEAVALAAALVPDVIVMDIQMPQMDGLAATRAIMAERPLPIIIISGHRDVREIGNAIEALRAGALTALPKPRGIASPKFQDAADHLVATIKTLSAVKTMAPRLAAIPASTSAREFTPAPAPLRSVEVVVVAGSLGGPMSLHQLLSELPREFTPPILVVQHLSAGFAAGLALSLEQSSAHQVRLARHETPLAPGCVYLAPPGHDLVLLDRTTIALRTRRGPGFPCPSADMLFQSSADMFRETVVALLLSGMDDDGIAGCRAVKAAGGRVIVENDSTSAVFGVAKKAVDAGLADGSLPIGAIASWLSSQGVARAA